MGSIFFVHLNRAFWKIPGDLRLSAGNAILAALAFLQEKFGKAS